ncbi:hypothetical protein [Streptomyces sp. NRRL B-24720]|uniref:hypothetical protein n=1 Tax=Streptomyces sp. NRRL B-24720 TaxID=1476876 RepID=UPI000B05A511|nr:hypothetical protein [Streptomyces sp. NRRL B-24720]
MTTTVDLVPGLITTRDAIAAAYGCGTFQGIEPADEAGKVFVYSDPSAGEEYGYTFDGRAEDDECGPSYLYTGAGANGNQKPSGRNGSLLSHAEKNREVHLFVAHGKVPGGGAMQQRYIGQMLLDPMCRRLWCCRSRVGRRSRRPSSTAPWRRSRTFLRGSAGYCAAKVN